MPTKTEKIPTLNEPNDYSIEDAIRSMGDALLRQNETTYLRVLKEFAAKLSPLMKRELRETLRTPELTFGIFKDDPMWEEIEQAIERNRERDREESATA